MCFIDECNADLERILKFKVKIDYRYGNSDVVEYTSDDEIEIEPCCFYVMNKDTGGLIARFTLQQLPGCCGVLVASNGTVNSKYRNLGVATRLNDFKYDLAYSDGYTAIMCTDVDQNLPQRKILRKKGWNDVYSFVNKRTDNTVHISMLPITGPRVKKKD